MKFSLALLSTVLGTAAAQAVTSKIAPSGAAPSGCATSYTGSFEVTVEAVKSANKAKRFIEVSCHRLFAFTTTTTPI